MNDKLLIWNESAILLFADLTEIVYKEQLDLKVVILSSKSSGQELSIYFKKNEEKVEWLETLKRTKQEKKSHDDQIHKAVFIVPKNSVSEKEPLIHNYEETSKCCCF